MDHPARTIVAPSPVHGRGVFATADVPAGCDVLELRGTTVDEAAAQRRMRERGADDAFVFVLEDGRYVDGSGGNDDALWLNHSCEPTCQAHLEVDGIVIRTLSGVGRGEELSIDYELTIEGPAGPDDLLQYACRCATPRCRGTMLDPDSLPAAS